MNTYNNDSDIDTIDVALFDDYRLFIIIMFTQCQPNDPSHQGVKALLYQWDHHLMYIFVSLQPLVRATRPRNVSARTRRDIAWPCWSLWHGKCYS